MRPDIAPGGTFPDYELPDHESVPRRLSELQGDDPLILTLARGHCPNEHQQHLGARERGVGRGRPLGVPWLEPLVRRQGERRPGQLT